MGSVLKSWRVGDYFRQLSTVVIGVLITFWGSDLVTQHARQREIRSLMQLIVQELQTNRKELQSIQSEIADDVRMSRLLQQAALNLDAIAPDTLRRYGTFFSSMTSMAVSAMRWKC